MFLTELRGLTLKYLYQALEKNFLPVTLTINSFPKRLSKTSWKKPVQGNKGTPVLGPKKL